MAEEKWVLVLDDERIVGDRLKPALEQAGFAVEVFTDSTAALTRLQEKSFSVLVTDLKMRGPSGLDVLRYAREKCPKTCVIVITAYASQEVSREVESLGAHHFVAKPFKTREFLRLVSEATAQAPSP
jgi:two-component system nitrogen regulation response regulator GlnG